MLIQIIGSGLVGAHGGSRVGFPDGGRGLTSTRREFLREGGAALAALSVAGTIGPAAAALARSAARKPGFALGFASLREETRLPDLPVEGRMPRGSRAPCCATAPPCSRSGPTASTTGSTASRCCTRSRSSAGRSPTRIASCARAPTGLETGGANPLLGVRRPTRAARSSRASRRCRCSAVPNANVSIERLGRRSSLDRDPGPGALRPRTLRTLGVDGRPPPRPARHRPPAPRPAHRGAVQLRDRPRPTQRPADRLGARGRRRELAWIPDSSPGTCTRSR